jgi:hypothetical protein
MKRNAWRKVEQAEEVNAEIYDLTMIAEEGSIKHGKIRYKSSGGGWPRTHPERHV